MIQLSLPLQVAADQNLFREEDFIALTENKAATDFLNKFFAQKTFSLAQFSSLILKGETASGKTHLLHIFAQKFQAEFLDHEKISAVNPANFFVADHFYILDDVDKIESEELVLRLINSATEAQAFLIMSTSIEIRFSLKDLASRFKNIFTAEIKNPSDESIKFLLSSKLAQKQIKLSRQVVDFVSDNISRSYEAVFDVLKLIEFHLQETGRNVGMAQIKRCLAPLNLH